MLSISVGLNNISERSSLAGFLKCAREMRDQGTFTYVREMVPMKEVREAFAAGKPSASVNVTT